MSTLKEVFAEDTKRRWEAQKEYSDMATRALEALIGKPLEWTPAPEIGRRFTLPVVLRPLTPEEAARIEADRLAYEATKAKDDE